MKRWSAKPRASLVLDILKGHAPVAKKLRAPVGDIYSRVESPRDELGDYLVSDGSERPARYKVRSPAFVNLSAMPVMLPGC